MMVQAIVASRRSWLNHRDRQADDVTASRQESMS